MRTYALIPARANSKGVTNKNLRLVHEKPLITYTLEVAKNVKQFDRVIVTTDSPEIAALAKAEGVEVPFIRPAEFAQDASPDRDYIEHALNWFQENEGAVPDLVAILRPTTPLREPDLLDKAVLVLQERFSEATALRSVHALPEPPQKMLQMENGWLTGFFPEDKRPDYFNLPRQTFPTAYQPNGYIDIVKTSYLEKDKNRIFGDMMLGFETRFSIEIDTPEALDYLAFTLEAMGKQNG